MTDQIDPEDDISQGYTQTAQIRQELNSPALQALRAAGGISEDDRLQTAESRNSPVKAAERTPAQEEYYQEQIAMGRKPEEIEKDEGVVEPSIDPVSDFIGGVFGAPLKIVGKQALKLTPALIRALGRGGSSVIAGYPIGMATEGVEEKYPVLALPFSVISGMVVGGTIESLTDKAILAASKKAGMDMTEDAVKQIRSNIMTRLQDQAGGYKPKGTPTGTGKIEDEAVVETVKSINDAAGFVANKKGIVDFGLIGDEVSERIGKPAAPIRLTREIIKHIEDQPGRIKAIQDLGYASTADFIEDVASNYNKIYQGSGESMILALQRNKMSAVFVELEPDEKNGFYKVKSALPKTRPDYLEGKKLLWDGAQTHQPSPGKGSLPSAISGQSNTNLNQSRQNVKPELRHFLGDPDKPLVEVSKEKVNKLLQGTETFLQQDVADLPEKAININFGRIESGDDIKEVLARTAEVFKDEIQTARRGVQSNEQTAKLAGLIGLSPEQLLARRRGQAFNAEEALAARRILVSSGERLSTLSRILSGKIPLAETEFSDATVPELQAAFQKQLLLHTGIQEQVSGITAEAGRALQSFRIMAKSTEGKLKQMDELMKNINKSKISPEDLAAMIAGIDSGEGLNTFVRQVRKATRWDMVMEAWINGLLSGPVTHSANMISNGLVALLQVPERAIATGFSKLAGSEEIKLAEAGYQAFGMLEGFKDGLKAFGKAVRTGQASDQFSKIDLPMRRAISAKNFGLDDPGVAARAVDLMGEGVRIPGRLLTAEDEFFKAIGYRMELNARAYRQAAQEGLTGDALTRRVKEIISDPPDDISSAAIDAARYQTFTKDLGEAGTLGQRFLAKAPALRLIVPFVQTPVNILKFAGERTPLAIVSKAIREEIAAGGARRDMALARISMGAMVMGTAATAAAAGMITGGGPSDPELKQALRGTGWQPYSIKLGDKYYAYNRLEPLGMLLGIAADASEIISQADEADANEIASAAVIAISKNVTSKTWLKGVADAVEALDDPDRSAKKFLMNYVRTFVPTGVAQIEKQVDPTVRETWDRSFFGEVANNIKARVPGWSSDLPTKRNLWGEAITWEGAFGPDILSPVYLSTAKHSPIDDEMVRLKMEVGMPAKIQSFEGEAIPLTPKEYDHYVQLMNKLPLPSTDMTLKKSLDHLVARDPDYRQASDERKEVMIKRYLLQAKEISRQQMLEEMPNLRYELDQIHHERMVRESGGYSRQRPAGKPSAAGGMPRM